MQYGLCDDTWDEREQEAIRRVAESGHFSMGEEVGQYESDFAERFGAKYAIMASSGSAANLLAIAALVYSGRLQKGDEVLVPAVSWSTTYFPLYQMGLKLRFVDIDRHTLNIDIEEMERAITPRTKMVFAVNLLGNPNDFDRLCKVCRQHNLLLAEDNCESMGALYKGKPCGTFGLFGTYSTFYSHHLCTMEGGMVVTDDKELYHYMLVIRAHGWTRNLPKDSNIYLKSRDDFYESYNFILPGFNLRPLEMEGAVGCEQLKKIDGILAMRRKNAAYFQEKTRGIKNIFTQTETGSSSWFGFSLVLDGEKAGMRDVVVKKLVSAGVEVRPVVAGNFTRNKAVRY
ncbi:MAG: DegT/DnrJ/EryC1/StrS family aminotransferase, partial [Lachnospiraceae bacterium]|nr:DegT/DnrJ/EryC1/StrS family aminotransferase [Lachnospiraceae bacterium]